MRKALLLSLAGLLLCFSPMAAMVTFAGRPTPPPDEGMWIPLLIERNIAAMQKLGLKLSAQDIYNVNSGSLKDAIVSFGGGCTGEIISSQGLVLTNHHCGYDYIQNLSTLEDNILANGFWAADRSKERPAPGLTVNFLDRIEDVTARISQFLADKTKERTEPLTEAEREELVQEAIGQITEKAGEEGKYEVEVKDMYYGNQYFLFVYKVYKDVRLVGTPPESLGKFGGDTDNWMWPRHTADFSLFRVYADKNNEPADYSADNVPLKPKRHLKVSLKGLNPDDFVMIMGYPGSTDRYATSHGIELEFTESNPARIKLRERRLAIMKAGMDADPAVRLKYASKYSQISNYYKYFIGQNKGLQRLRTVEVKRAQEARFQQWVEADATRKAKYGTLLADIGAGYQELQKSNLPFQYLQEAGAAPEIIIYALQYNRLYSILSKNPKAKAEELAPALGRITDFEKDHWKNYDATIDRNLLAAMFRFYVTDLKPENLPEIFAEIQKKYGNDFDRYAADVFARSFLVSEAKTKAFLQKPNAKVLEKDPAFRAMRSIVMNYFTQVLPAREAAENKLQGLFRKYLEALQEWQADKVFYPDANFTQRLTYGKVSAYKPYDAVSFTYQTTLDGVIEKEDPTSEEFVLPRSLRELWEKQDYGQYGILNAQGKKVLPVCFISDTDITGGNSGSPVLNGNGELVGLAFDGNWEAMTGDLVFDPEYKRTISVDVRYVLWLVDKFAGAGHIVQELDVVR
jgi:hypothetical protein